MGHNIIYYPYPPIRGGFTHGPRKRRRACFLNENLCDCLRKGFPFQSACQIISNIFWHSLGLVYPLALPLALSSPLDCLPSRNYHKSYGRETNNNGHYKNENEHTKQTKEKKEQFITIRACSIRSPEEDRRKERKKNYDGKLIYP